jgi:hypothetical protein
MSDTLSRTSCLARPRRRLTWQRQPIRDPSYRPVLLFPARAFRKWVLCLRQSSRGSCAAHSLTCPSDDTPHMPMQRMPSCSRSHVLHCPMRRRSPTGAPTSAVTPILGQKLVLHPIRNAQPPSPPTQQHGSGFWGLHPSALTMFCSPLVPQWHLHTDKSIG